jgi:hypothetical protein
MNIYSRLLRLYRTNMLRTPLEDFTTEILAGILNTFPEIGEEFAQNILALEGEQFSYTTQANFQIPDPAFPNCRVDLVIRSTNMICFVECKVEASEGFYQLERYGLALDGLSTENKTFLRYCTKYYDLKSHQSHDFRQFRWADVYRFLSKRSDSDIINHFLEFLNDHDMSDNMEFNLSDLMTMQGLNPTIHKMNRYLEKIRQVFRIHFPQARIKDSGNINQIKDWSRFIFHTERVFGENGYSEMGVGFSFADTPELRIWIWCGEKNPQSMLFKTALLSSGFDNNGEDWLALNSKLSDFISSEHMEVEIEEWFAMAFERIQVFKSTHPELLWHI